MWTELHAPPAGDPTFADAQYYWEVGEDPKVQRRDFADNWRNVDYVVTTPQMIADAGQQDFAIVTPALEHSRPIADFNTGGWRWRCGAWSRMSEHNCRRWPPTRNPHA